MSLRPEIENKISSYFLMQQIRLSFAQLNHLCSRCETAEAALNYYVEHIKEIRELDIVDATTLTRWQHDDSIRPAGPIVRPPNAQLNNHVSLWHGDITKLRISSIVNAANETLLGGGGIDGAIHAAAGGGLWNECRNLGGCSTGESKITAAYELPCDHVIHTVGPRFTSTEESCPLLASCYRTCLQTALSRGIRSICFCCISTGLYGYPQIEAADVATSTVRDW